LAVPFSISEPNKIRLMNVTERVISDTGIMEERVWQSERSGQQEDDEQVIVHRTDGEDTMSLYRFEQAAMSTSESLNGSRQF